MAAGEALHVAVGSKNPVKVNAVGVAFRKVFPSRDVVLHGFDAATSVSDQPVNDRETRTGAFNRAIAASKLFAATAGALPDFAVGLEGGVLDEVWTEPTGGLETIEVRRVTRLSCMAWMAVYHPASESWGEFGSCFALGMSIQPFNDRRDWTDWYHGASRACVKAHPCWGGTWTCR